jgi:hypothetical protein
MRRAALQIFAAVLAAGIIGTALTVLFWDTDDEPLAVDVEPSATPTQRPLTLSPTSPTPSITASATPSSSPAGSPTSAPGPRPSFQPASQVDCDRTPAFCSSTSGTMELKDDKLVTSGTTQHQTDYSAVPNTTMTWKIIRDGGGDARNGDDVSKLEVVVEIRNDTDDTFVVPDREIILLVSVDGEKLHELATTGEDFTMRPGGSLTARYDIPLAGSGSYDWRARTSFYER